MAASANQMRKSVENLVMSSHDAIGQSISHALSFSGAITQQGTQHSAERKSASRSPSPCRRSGGNTASDRGDGSMQSSESDNARTRRTAESFLSTPSPQPTFTVSTPLPEQPSLLPLNRSASQECQPRFNNQSVTSLSVTNLNTTGQQKNQETRTKKKSWYNSLYPTYKSRSEDFKRIFKDIPDDERLIVDYSCAIQKDILVHGRLYVSQKYLCFYANIFRWETLLSLQWKDVSAITKEKTALVIPNAILVCTDKEKHFFTSFSGRDKAYMMLFTIWQNALMDKSISTQEMWDLVHSCYGEQLGFDSDDEDYPQCLVDEDKLSNIQISAESISEELKDQSMLNTVLAEESYNQLADLPLNSTAPPQSSHWSRSTNGTFNGGDTLPTDMSDTSDSEPDKPIGFNHENHGALCTDPHEGRKLLGEEFPFHIDQLFTMLFTNSKFYVELLASRKTTDLVQASWKHDTESGLKCRKVSFTIVLAQAIGPKTTAVTESQVMQSCTKPGHVYSIDVTSCNAGIPYAESFTVVVHYCLQRVSDNVTLFQVYGQIKYKKSVWGFVKSIIEKNAWMGLEEYFDYLTKALHVEIEEERGPLKRGPRGRRRGRRGISRESEVGSLPASPLHRPLQSRKSLTGTPLHERIPLASAIAPSSRLVWAVLAILCFLVIINGALYWRLWNLEDNKQGFFGDFNNVISETGNNPSPQLIAEWSQILKDQSSFHIEELDKWRKALNDAISLLKQTESALANLQSLVKPSMDKIQSSQSTTHSDL